MLVFSFWRRFSRCAHRPLSTPDVLIFWPSKHLRLVKRKETLVAEAQGKENKNLAGGKNWPVDRILALFATLANDVVNCPAGWWALSLKLVCLTLGVEIRPAPYRVYL